MNLFIIGNGFDLSHNIPTSYQGFHLLFKHTYYDGEIYSLSIPESTLMPDGGIEYNQYA